MQYDSKEQLELPFFEDLKGLILKPFKSLHDKLLPFQDKILSPIQDKLLSSIQDKLLSPIQDKISSSLNTWPPQYTIRQSARSRRVTLSISPQKGLEVVVPTRLKRRPNIDRLLDEKRHWIEKHLMMQKEARQKQQREMKVLPILLHFRAVNKKIHLTYQSLPRKNIKITPIELPVGFNSNTIHNSSSIVSSISAVSTVSTFSQDFNSESMSYLLSGPIEDSTLVYDALRKFVKTLAKQFFAPWLTQLSQELQLPYSSLTIRSQSTLWGSCTRARKISLNNKLLFLPSNLTRYILVHELCHIKHLNHSKRFWDLVQKFDPEWKLHRRQMRHAGEQYVPAWLEQSS